MRSLSNTLKTLKSTVAVDTLQIIGLSSFAFAQPLFALLTEYAEFFTVYKSEPEHLLAFTLVAIVAPGIAFALPVMLAGLFGSRIRKVIHGILIAILVMVIVLPILIKSTLLMGAMAIVAAILAGTLIAWLYFRGRFIQTFLTYISPAIVIFPMMFLCNPVINDLAFPGEVADEPQGTSVKRPIPVVMVIFDEFTVTSLMDRQHNIDQLVYPNLAWFAERSHWYRNATTVSDNTVFAVPAILSGLYPTHRQPTYQEYPVNVFTLLKTSHHFNVHESGSKLCPPTLCKPLEARQSFSNHMIVMLSDLMIVYLHIIVPRDYASYLPDISQGWNNFQFTSSGRPANSEPNLTEDDRGVSNLIHANMRLDRAGLWDRFVSAISKTTRPSLNLMHILLPHAVLEYLPSGRNYGRRTTTGLSGKWNNDSWAVKQAWQRHLMQLAYVDKLLGKLFRKLEKEGLFDEALIIITADHGLSFKTQDYHRPITATNYMDILPVPLFIKLPQQTEGIISDINVEVVDILPSIIDELQISTTTPLDGISVFDRDRIQQRLKKTLFTAHLGARTLKYPSKLEEKYDTLEERLALFGADQDPNKLFVIGPDKKLIGMKVDDLPVTSDPEVRIEVVGGYREGFYGAGQGPNYVNGSIISELAVPVRLALSVNDVVHAVTQTFLPSKEGEHKFTFLVPESAYRDETNKIEIYSITGRLMDDFSLRRTPRTVYFLDETRSSISEIESLEKMQYQIDSSSVLGHVDVLRGSHDLLVFKGWAADIKNKKPAKRVLLFVDGEFVSSSKPEFSRPDVVAVHNENGYLITGYAIDTQLKHKQHLCTGNFDLYGISESGFASELIIAKSLYQQLPGC